MLFADTRENRILLRSALSSFTVSKSLLESVEGKLVLCDITQVKISKDVTPELLREKVLAFSAIVSIKAIKRHSTKCSCSRTMLRKFKNDYTTRKEHNV